MQKEILLKEAKEKSYIEAMARNANRKHRREIQEDDVSEDELVVNPDRLVGKSEARQDVLKVLKEGADDFREFIKSRDRFARRTERINLSRAQVDLAKENLDDSKEYQLDDKASFDAAKVLYKEAKIKHSELLKRLEVETFAETSAEATPL
jgi:hypothetical protein